MVSPSNLAKDSTRRERSLSPRKPVFMNHFSLPLQDCLILEKSEMHHHMCSFQDDFQEFEMIDDEDDEEDDEVDPEDPPSPLTSPSLSPTLGTLKSRPTTLNLTTAVSQVCSTHTHTHTHAYTCPN